jgi:hypothetical protein
LNVHPGATLNSNVSFGNGMTINNEGTVNFTFTNASFNGTFVFNNQAGATMNVPNATNFVMGNNSTFNNYGTMHITNLENEEAYLNNFAGGTLIVDRSMNNHGAFINNGDFQLPCNTLAGAPGATTCSFRVGDKGVGKEFISNACIKVFNANATFDGAGTVNAGFEIGAGYNLTLNKTVTGTNGSFLIKGGTSTINLSGNYVGTNMKFYDVNSAGNDFDSKLGNNPTSYTVDSGAGCGGAATCTQPSAITLVQTAPTCNSATANNNGKITFTSVTGVDKYFINSGAAATGTYATATAIPVTGTAIQSNIPNTGGTYTIRFYNGANDCFKDETITIAPVACGSGACGQPLCGNGISLKKL